MNDERLHIRVGAVTLVLLAALVAAVLGLQGKHLRPGVRVHVELESVGALTEGGKVQVAGRQIGSIDRIRLLPLKDAPSYAEDPTATRARVVLDVWVDARWRHVLRENSEFFQNQPSVLGEAYLEVGPPPGGAEPGPELRDGDSVRGVDPPRLDRIAQKSYDNLAQATELLREGLPEARAFGRALDELATLLDETMVPADLTALREGGGRFWREGLAAADAYRQSGFDPARLERSSARAQRLIATARARIAALRAKLDHLLAEAARIRDALGPERLARFDAVVRKYDAVLVRVDHVLAGAQALADLVARGEGTIGAFLQDTEIADEFKAASKVLKQRPWEAVGHPPR